jgi:rhodanese-related sulfurtransferase
MKKRTFILSLVLSLALVFSAFTSLFAAGPATEATKKAIVDAKVQSVPTLKNEVDAEAFAKALYDQATEGKYQLIDTATLKNELGKVVIIDTMPEAWYNQRHIPGAVCQIVGANNGPEFKILPEEKTALLKTAKAAVGKKTVTKWYNKKTKKWTTKKPAKKYRGKSKKVKVVNKDKKIVVYCGFVKCQRSHQAAMFLTEQGFTNVYRYAGGISAWVDANNEIEGTDVAQ